MAKKPKFAIIGVGPVGGIFGGHLANGGHYVVLVDILKSHLDVIRGRGLIITGVTEMKVKCERIAYDISELPNFPEVDTIIISTKASVMPFILPQIEKVAKPGTKFISLQNGLDNEEFIAATFGRDNVMRIVVNYAGNRVADGEIWMSFFNNPNYIGVLTPKAEPLAREIAAMMTEAKLDTQFTTDIKRHEWEKTILNAALSPICALTRKTMKEMMDFEPTRSLVEETLREGIEVAAANGVVFDEGFFDHCVQYLKKAGYHKTSMHVDIEQRSLTEIDWLSGKIVERGLERGLQTPYNTTLTALIKGLEKESEASEQ